VTPKLLMLGMIAALLLPASGAPAAPRRAAGRKPRIAAKPVRAAAPRPRSAVKPGRPAGQKPRAGASAPRPGARSAPGRIKTTSPSLYQQTVSNRDWPMPRHDRGLTNRSPLKNSLTEAPRELWRLSTAVWAGELDVWSDESSASIAMHLPVPPASASPEQDGRRPERSPWKPRLLDVAGDGQPVNAPRGYWGRLIPGSKGLQRVQWTSTWGHAPSRLQCFSYEEGPSHPRLVWETEPEKDVWLPSTCIADVDGDGSLEIAVATHYRVMIFEGATGKKRHELRYHNLRNYGFFGLFSLPGDRHARFVTISGFAGHYDVLDYDGMKLSVAFRRDIEGTEGGGILRHRKILRPGPNPLADLDGDGRPEMTFNLFNDRGDERWHVLSYALPGGAVKLDLDGQYLVGIYDVDGDGQGELFCQSAPHRNTTGWRTLSVLKLRDGKAETLLRLASARFGTFDLIDLPPTVDTWAEGGRATIAAGPIGPRGEPGFVVLRPGEDRRAGAAEAYIWQNGGFARGWTVPAPAGGTVSVLRVEGRDEGSIVPPGEPAHVLLSLSGPAEACTLVLRSAGAQVRKWAPKAHLAPHPIAVTGPDGGRLILETSNGRVAAYRLAKAGPPALLWERPGRGMGLGNAPGGALAAGDLDGDGQPEVLFATQDPPTGAAALVAADLEGRERWRHVFPGYDDERPLWNFGGLTLWTPAHLTDPRRMDVYVNTRHSTMHSDISVVLDGRTGKPIWTGDAVPVDGKPTWGFGGTLVACVDLLRNGLEQIVSGYPVVYYVVDGRTGAFVRSVDLATRKVLPGWAAYGVPVAADFRSEGRLQILLPSPYVYGLLTPEGAPLWSSVTVPNPASTPPVEGPAVGNFDGERGLEVARLFAVMAPSDRPRLEILDGATGKLKGPTLEGNDLSLKCAAVADVDGNGTDEILMRTAPATLGAVTARGGQLRILWQVTLPAEPVYTIIADVNGDGTGEILTGCANGSLVALGRQAGATQVGITSESRTPRRGVPDTSGRDGRFLPGGRPGAPRPGGCGRG